MTSTNDVLESIDDAIADWELGPDAVRFNAPAEVKEAQAPPPRIVLLIDLWDHYAPAIQRMAAIVNEMHAQWTRLHEQGRCPWCHPRANPPKLPIIGAEYSRRRRGRRRRG